MPDLAFLQRPEPDGQPGLDIVVSGTFQRVGRIVCDEQATCDHLTLHYGMGLRLRGKHWWLPDDAAPDQELGQGGGGGSLAGSPVKSSGIGP